MIPAIWRTPIVDAETAAEFGLDMGWDAEWADMTPAEKVADMLRYMPSSVLHDAMTENDTLWFLYCQWRLEKLKGDTP
jgi:hypothetical protein